MQGSELPDGLSQVRKYTSVRVGGLAVSAQQELINPVDQCLLSISYSFLFWKKIFIYYFKNYSYPVPMTSFGTEF